MKFIILILLVNLVCSDIVEKVVKCDARAGLYGLIIG